eukprot:15915258-Heterocapsa_arctica.AAC.1
MKTAALVDGSPPSVEQFLRLVPCKIDCYEDLKMAVKSFIARGASLDSQGNERTVPMDVGAVTKEDKNSS